MKPTAMSRESDGKTISPHTVLPLNPASVLPDGWEMSENRLSGGLRVWISSSFPLPYPVPGSSETVVESTRLTGEHKFRHLEFVSTIQNGYGFTTYRDRLVLLVLCDVARESHQPIIEVDVFPFQPKDFTLPSASGSRQDWQILVLSLYVFLHFYK